MVSFAGMIVFVAMGRKQIDKQKIRPQKRLRSNFSWREFLSQGFRLQASCFKRG